MHPKEANDAQKTLKVSSSISKKLTKESKAKQIAESKERAVHRFDIDGNCKMPLKELLQQHNKLHSAYAMLYAREWNDFEGRGTDEPASAISGVVMDAHVEGGKFGEDASAALLSSLVWRLLAACHSGSTSGDVWRRSEVIRAALQDVRLAPKGTKNHFDMTYGISDAIMRSDTIELSGQTFNFLAAQWRAIFTSGQRERVANLAALGVSDEQLNDAEEMYKFFCKGTSPQASRGSKARKSSR
jgi:hypothetical protein